MGPFSLLSDRFRYALTSPVNDEFVESTIGAIAKSAVSGGIGDGKIFILPLEECIRIRTNKTGKKAIG